MDSGDSPQMDTTVQKDINGCIDNIEKVGLDWVQARADARDQIFKAKCYKIDEILTKSRDDLIQSLREKVAADRAVKDADIAEKTALLNSVLGPMEQVRDSMPNP
ncbi:hypothetical protein IGI04_006734 [Brassica rapa subsp. trilocularis]|uniref:Uncharacterized protein n=1 Tax=Brassica rapa subsp. trilocularis TaxID=1813537 RepID=A0ABQ7NHS3_BRACM|nr:hypothetical protein IGI04_006729 [Brassica rapa subsp. trilocularis]KAG5410415.1 hypothetical protein IGI04_006734 [Brassica rapa subsp. trilocularis]